MKYAIKTKNVNMKTLKTQSNNTIILKSIIQNQFINFFEDEKKLYEIQLGCQNRLVTKIGLMSILKNS